MLRRGLWEIARRSSSKTDGRTLSSSSGSYRSVVSSSSSSSSTNAARAAPTPSFRPTLDARTEKRQTSRDFSDAPNLSTRPESMDGEGDRKVPSSSVDYATLLEAQKAGDFIIDVREQSEINETGKLPGSIHIPMGDVANQLQNLSSEAFRDKFEKTKPEKDTKIILSCRSGMRSGKVQEQLQKLGYENVYNYTGGWMDWESRHKV